METYESRSQYRDDVYGTHPESGFKDRLGRIGRRIKHVDLRSQIVEHPFTAVGIAAAVGALVGLVRPMPRRGRISGAFVAALTAIGFRLVREAAFVHLGQYARDLISKEPPPQSTPPNAPRPGTRYGY